MTKFWATIRAEVSFPIITIIAGFGLTVIGLLIVVGQIIDSLKFLSGYYTSPSLEIRVNNIDFLVLSLIVFLIGLSFIGAGISLFKKKKIGWWIGEITLVIFLFVLFRLCGAPFLLIRRVCYSSDVFYVVIILTLLFIFLLLDRKNFFKIAS